MANGNGSKKAWFQHNAVKVMDKCTSVGPKPGKDKYKVLVYYGGDTPLVPMFVQALEISSNFIEDGMDYILLTCTFPAGDFMYDIVANKNNITISLHENIGLTRENGNPMLFNPETLEKNKEKPMGRFKAYLVNNNSIDSSRFGNSSREKLNETDVINAEFQLIDTRLDLLRIYTFGGVSVDIGNGGTPLDKYMKATIDDNINKLKDNGEPIASTISYDVVKPDNISIGRRFVLPQDLTVYSFVKFMQEGEGLGVYDGGCNFYTRYCGKTLETFLYPIWDKRRYDDSSQVRKLHIHQYPDLSLKNSEKTWNLDGDTLNIVVFKRPETEDNGMLDLSSQGSGIILTNPGLALTANNAMVDGDIMVSADTNTSYVQPKVPDGAPIVYREVHNITNTALVFTEENKKTMCMYQFEWMHSEPVYINPGMPCAYSFVRDDNDIVTLKGTVAVMYSRWTKVSGINYTMVGVMLESYQNWKMNNK